MHKIIGYRELHTENGEPVEITMYLPFFSDEYKAYICQYKISKYDYVDEGRAIGEDMLQAIYLAMIKLGAILSYSDFWKNKIYLGTGIKILDFLCLIIPINISRKLDSQIRNTPKAA